MIAKQPKRRKRPAKTKRDPVVGVRLTPVMKAALDEIALENHSTRAAVMRDLIQHALKSPPNRTGKR